MTTNPTVTEELLEITLLTQYLMVAYKEACGLTKFAFLTVKTCRMDLIVQTILASLSSPLKRMNNAEVNKYSDLLWVMELPPTL